MKMMENKMLLTLNKFDIEYLFELLLKENQILMAKAEMLEEENNRLRSRIRLEAAIDEAEIA